MIQYLGNTKTFSRIYGCHLESRHRLNPLGRLRDVLQNSCVLLLREIQNFDHRLPASFGLYPDSTFSMSLNCLCYIMPCRTLTHLGIHSESQTFNDIFLGHTFVIPCSRRSLRTLADASHPQLPGEMTICYLPARSVACISPIIRVIPIDHPREVHHFTNANHVWTQDSASATSSGPI